MLLLLYLSAAFDTVDHHILFARLTDWFGVDCNAPDWCKSYPSGGMRSSFLSVVPNDPVFR